MKRVFIFAAITMVSAGTFAAAEGPFRLGVDIAQPYTLAVDGSSVKKRSNLNMGADGRYFFNENFNAGARVSFDVEKRKNTPRQISVAPGIQYMWMPGERFRPYFRGDIPVLLRGAADTAGSAKRIDMGISAGFGLAWDLGNAIGIHNMLVRYDFNMGYTFGVGRALPVLTLEFFKVGFDYRF